MNFLIAWLLLLLLHTIIFCVFISKYFLTSLTISSLAHWLFRGVVFIFTSLCEFPKVFFCYCFPVSFHYLWRIYFVWFQSFKFTKTSFMACFRECYMCTWKQNIFCHCCLDCFIDVCCICWLECCSSLLVPCESFVWLCYPYWK